jgi:hypothetical protein
MVNDLYVIVRDEEDDEKTEIGKKLNEQGRQKYSDNITLGEMVDYVAKEEPNWPNLWKDKVPVLRGYLKQEAELKNSVLAIVLDQNEDEKSNGSGGRYFSLDEQIGSLMNRNITDSSVQKPFDSLYVILDPHPYLG